MMQYFKAGFIHKKELLNLLIFGGKVVDKRSDAKLAMIGDGPLMENVKLKIKI